LVAATALADLYRQQELEDQQCQVFFDSQDAWLASPEGMEALAEFLEKHPDGENI
jgi:hypothetical protein